MNTCISCSNSTSFIFKVRPKQGKFLCDDCRNGITKTKLENVVWFRSSCLTNLCCEFCFNVAAHISISENSFKVICQTCSMYEEKIVPLEWIDLFSWAKNPQIYEDRTSLLRNYDQKCEEVKESFDKFIVSMTGMYNSCKAQIKNSADENVRKIDEFENELIRVEEQIRNGCSVEEKKVFFKNLEALQNEIVSLELVSGEELKQVVLENVDIVIEYTQNFGFLL